MMVLRQPSELPLRQVYRQARKLAGSTSRSSNPDWYRPAIDLDRQWHVMLDGGAPVSCILDRRSGNWYAGPDASFFFPHPGALEDSMDTEVIRATLDDVIRNREYGGRARSLGVVLHIADEFAVTDLAPDLPADLEMDDLRRNLEMNPRSTLGDSQLDTVAQTWKLLPCWGVSEGDRRAIAIRLSKIYHPVLEAMRKHGEKTNIPVVTSALSAPLEALQLTPSWLRAPSGKGDLLFFQYLRFSAIAVLNEVGEFVQMRSVPHRGNMGYPQAPGDLLINAAASMNLEAPVVHVVPMGSVEHQALQRELAVSPAQDFGLELRYPDPSAELAAHIPGQRLEMLMACPEELEERRELSALRETVTFERITQGWAAQDFAGATEDEMAVYPARRELMLLKLAGNLKLLLTIATFCLAGWAGYQGALMAKSGSWGISEVEVSARNLELQDLQSEEGRITYWESMMQPRSEGWLAMELLLELISEDASFLLTSCKYEVTGEPPSNRSRESVAFRRTWNIEGYARQDTMTQMARLGSNSFMKEVFNRIGETSGNPAWSTDLNTRDLSVTIQQSRGEYPRNGILSPTMARQYQTSFNLSIVQSFSDKDPLAILREPFKQPVAEPQIQ